MPDEIMDPETIALANEPEPTTTDPTPEDAQPRDPETGQFVNREELEKVQRERDAERERLAQLEAENAALRRPPTADPPVQSYAPRQQEAAPEPEFKFYSRSELNSAVERGIITEEQRDDRLELQREKRTEKIVRDTLQRERVVQESTSTIQGYVSLMPDLGSTTSENYQRFAEEWAFHTRQGLPDNDSTKLIALRSAFGPLERLQRTKEAAAKNSPRPAHSEIGEGATPSSGNTTDLLHKLPQAEKAEYQRLVDAGHMTWAEVREELKFAAEQTVNPNLRLRAVR